MRTGRIPSLEAARGLAALMVVAVHVNSFHVQDGVDQAGWLHFTSYGYLGVVVFFVLSGLVLYLPYAGGKRLDLLGYLAARGLRIVPGLWVALGISATLFGLWSWTTVRSAFFLNGDSYASANPIPPAWTLTIEMGFYLLLPLVVWAFARRPQYRVFILLAMVTVGALARNGFYASRWPMNPLVYLDVFAFGLVAAIVVARFGHARPRILPLAALAFIVGCAAVNTGTYMTNAIIVACLFAISLATLALVNPRIPRLFVWLGTVSYGVYLWHWPVLKITTAHGLYRLPDSLEIVVVAVLSITLGWLSWKIVEMPALRLRPQVVRLLRMDKPNGGLPATGRVAADHD